MNIKIMKFGGTSVGNPDAINKVINILSHEKEHVSVVVSAYSKVTDLLIEIAHHAYKRREYQDLYSQMVQRHRQSVKELVTGNNQKTTLQEVEAMCRELKSVLEGVFLIQELTPKTLDFIMSFGERLSAYIISQACISHGLRAQFVDTRKLIVTNSTFGKAMVDFKKTNRNIHNYFKKNPDILTIVTGFIGSTDAGETTTLGRGGSDYTASIFGAALFASSVEIWTDVDGVLTADPRQVPSAFSIPSMTYQEAMEMSHFGAKVIYAPTMIPVFHQHIPLVIKNTFHPTFSGTRISNATSNEHVIKGISSITNIVLLLVQGGGMVGVPGMAARLFGVLAKNNINVIMITQASSEYTICFAIEPKDTDAAKKALQKEFKNELIDHAIDAISVEENLSIIAIVGEQMRKKSGVSGKVFTALGDHKISVIAAAQGSSERNISLVVTRRQEEQALQAIHEAFFGT